MLDRRDILKSLSSLPLIGGLGGSTLLSKSVIGSPLRRDYFKELGVRTFINAAGTYTSMSGCLMNPEVVEAIQNSARTGETVILSEGDAEIATPP